MDDQPVWQRHLFVAVGLLVGIGCSDQVDDSLGDATDDVTGNSGDATTDVGSDTASDSEEDGSDDESGSETSGGESEDPPELPAVIVDPNPVHWPVPGAWPAAAFDGDSYLVVWEDHRLRRPILYGARVGADGTALDPYGFEILDAVADTMFDHVYEPAVGFDGENYLVVTMAWGWIFGVRVSPAGEVLDPGGFIIAEAEWAGWLSPPSLVFDGEQWLVAWWQSIYPAAGILLARVQPDGTVLDPGGVFVHESSGYYESPVAISFDGSNALLAWTSEWSFDSQLLYAGLVAADGTLIDTPMLLSPAGEFVGSRVAGFDGTNHVVVWSSPGSGIRASRITPQGTLLDPDGLLIADTGPEHFGRVNMAARNSHSIVVWSGSFCCNNGYWTDPIRAARIATDGTISPYDDGAFPIGLEVTVAAHPDGALMLWRDSKTEWYWRDHLPIVGTRLDAAGVPVENGVVMPASTASRQDVKAVASDGQNSLVLWTDVRDAAGSALHAARVGPDGTPLDDEFLEITPGPVRSAEVVFDGANYVVTWLDLPPSGYDGDNPFNTVRISPAGERLDVVPLHPPLCAHVVATTDGTHTLLVGGHCSEGKVWAVLFDQAGAVASEPVLVPGVDSWSTAASFDGTGYLVVSSVEDQLLGQRITQAGMLDGPPFLIFEGWCEDVAIAGGNGSHLVVCETNDMLWSTHVSSDGQVLDPEGLVLAELDVLDCFPEPDLDMCSAVSAIFDGENFVVAWRALADADLPSTLDLYAVEVSTQGDVSTPFLISHEPEREGAPFLAVNDEGQVLAAYNRFVPGPPYDTRRAVTTPLP